MPSERETTLLRKRILENMLGKSYLAYENFYKTPRLRNSKRQHRQRIPLWQFLLHLLHQDEARDYIEWSQGTLDLEFRIKSPAGVASLWGSIKDKSSMTYEKLGRAMRYYYGKNIIEKVSCRRYSYRFISSPKTERHLNAVMMPCVSPMPMLERDGKRWRGGSRSLTDGLPTMSRLRSSSSSTDESYDTGSDSGFSAYGTSSLSNDECSHDFFNDRYIFESDSSTEEDDEGRVDATQEAADELFADCLAKDDGNIDVSCGALASQRPPVTDATSWVGPLYEYESGRGVCVSHDPFFGFSEDVVQHNKCHYRESVNAPIYSMDEVDGKCYFSLR